MNAALPNMEDQDPEEGLENQAVELALEVGLEENEGKSTRIRIHDILMWSMLLITLLVAIFLSVDVFFRRPSSGNFKDPNNTAMVVSSDESLPSNLEGHQEILVAGQNFAVVDKTMVETQFDSSSFQTVSIPGRIKRYARSLMDKIRASVDRREIQMSSRVSTVLTVISLLIIAGCTGLAVQAGFMNEPIVDVALLHMAKRVFFYVSYVLATLTMVLMVFTLYVVPDNKVLQVMSTVVALLAIIFITGAMISDLIYRAQATVFSESLTTDASKFGIWLTHFGLGGVMAFAMGAFGCWIAVFGVEMILFRVKNTPQEPILMNIALPASILYNLGSTQLSLFQKVLKVALVLRLVLWGLAFLMPHLAAL